MIHDDKPHKWWQNGGKLTVATMLLASVAILVFTVSTVQEIFGSEYQPLSEPDAPYLVPSRVAGVDGPAIVSGDPLVVVGRVCVDEDAELNAAGELLISVNAVIERVDEGEGAVARSLIVAGTFPIRRPPGCTLGERRFVLQGLPPGRYVVAGTDTAADADPVYWETEPFQVVNGER